MKKLTVLSLLFILLTLPSALLASPNIYPVATTIYKPGSCYNGYTILAGDDAYLIDMNGNLVHSWPGAKAFPAKIYPGGFIGVQERDWPKGFMDYIFQQIRDFDNNIVWSFDQYEKGKTSGVWGSRQHHDFQIKGNPVYFSPESKPVDFGKGTMLICGHWNVKHKKINKHVQLVDDSVYEVDMATGKVVWEWRASDHVDEFGFDRRAFKAMRSFRIPESGMEKKMLSQEGAGFDWWHQNCANYLGPNKWYDQGDERFHPDNIILDSRYANVLVIIDRKTGKVVWRVGPDYTKGEDKEIGQIIGPHHAHIIPKGLPGEGNVMVYDNGGWGGYGKPNAMSPTGIYNTSRDYSRVIEFDPITKKIVWEYSVVSLGLKMGDKYNSQMGLMEYSPYQSNAQRLPNGNTMICESNGSRVFEVTPKLEVVWEYISPYLYDKNMPFVGNMIYRAYRLPYDWVPQLEKPKEVAVFPPNRNKFFVPAVDGSTPDIGEDKKKQWNPAWGKRN